MTSVRGDTRQSVIDVGPGLPCMEVNSRQAIKDR